MDRNLFFASTVFHSFLFNEEGNHCMHGVSGRLIKHLQNQVTPPHNAATSSATKLTWRLMSTGMSLPAVRSSALMEAELAHRAGTGFTRELQP